MGALEYSKEKCHTIGTCNICKNSDQLQQLEMIVDTILCFNLKCL